MRLLLLNLLKWNFIRALLLVVLSLLIPYVLFCCAKSTFASRRALATLPANGPDTLDALHRSVQETISRLQNPEDQCEGDSKVLVCRDDNGHSGFGSACHRYVVCLQVAYGLGRVAIFSKPEYAHFGGYSRWMEPVTRACAHLEALKFSESEMQENNVANRKLWIENFTELAVSPKYLFLDITFKFPYPRHIPGTVPIHLHDRLSALGVAEPWRWFYGQFVFYLLGRPNAGFVSKVNSVKESISFQSPVIGVHIRHSLDKVSKETDFVAPRLYADKAVSIFSSRYGTATPKTIYLASDIATNFNYFPSLLPPNYRVISMPEKLRKYDLLEYFRENFDPGVLDVFLIDFYLLWKADVLICTLSSNVCRLISELKYATGADVANTIFSMDADYFCDFPGYQVGDNLLMTARESTPRNGENLLHYKAGEIFVRAQETFQDGPRYISGLMNLKSRLAPTRQGLVKIADIVPWPGWPVYPDYDI